MPRAPKSTDPWSAFVDLLADTLVARLDFPPRASSATSALNGPTAAPASPFRRRKRRRPPANAARLVDDLMEALSARVDFPPRASSAASALAPPRVRKRAPPGGTGRAPARPVTKLLAKRSTRSRR